MSETRTLTNRCLSITSTTCGGSLLSLRMKAPNGQWFDLAQNAELSQKDLPPVAYLNMYEQAGRVEGGSFQFDSAKETFQDGDPTVGLDTRYHQHALHGIIRMSQFGYVGPSLVTSSSIQMNYDSRTDENKPKLLSDLTAVTTYSLEGSSLEVFTKVTNVGDRSMPVSSGSHPFLAKYPMGTMKTPELTFNAEQMMDQDPAHKGEAMPDGEPHSIRGEDDFSIGMVPEERYDNVFMGWDGVFKAEWKDIGLKLLLEDISEITTPFLHLWWNQGFGTWAPEPVTSPGNSFKLKQKKPEIDWGIRILKPGESSSFRHRYTWTFV